MKLPRLRKRCGTCKHYRGRRDGNLRECKARFRALRDKSWPACVVVGIRMTAPNEGTRCPLWEMKE